MHHFYAPLPTNFPHRNAMQTNGNLILFSTIMTYHSPEDVRRPAVPLGHVVRWWARPEVLVQGAELDGMEDKKDERANGDGDGDPPNELAG